MGSKSAFLWLLGMSVVVGCGSSGTSSSVTASAPTSKNEDFLIGSGIRASITPKKELLIKMPTGFQPSGEEKLQFKEVSVPIMASGKSVQIEAFVRRKFGVTVVETDRGEAEITVPEDGQIGVRFLKEPQGSGIKISIPGLKRVPISESVEISFEKNVSLSNQLNSLLDELRIGVRRSEFPVAEHGMGPFGLSADFYNGHTFWDADVWMLPTLLFTEPDGARAIAEYRLSRFEQAQKNADDFFKGNVSGAAMFPWESSVTGKETIPGPSQKEHHISGSVLWGLNQVQVAGLIEPKKVKPVDDAVAKFYAARSIAGTGRGRELLDTMSPDEHFIGNNDLYTNLLAQWAMNGRKWDGSTRFYLPKDEKSFLTYDNDGLRGYKQAAAVLAIYPLEFPEAEKQAEKMMERFEPKIIKNGPAMSESVHAVIWSRLSKKDRAFESFKKSIDPFLQPNLEFSEKRKAVRTFFYTGAAGVLNSVIYGFAGFRLDSMPQPGASFTKKLKSGWFLSIKPNVPEALGTLTLKNFVIDGERFDIVCSVDGTAKMTAR